MWLCPRTECLRQAVKRGGFSRSLRRPVTVPSPEALAAEMTQALQSGVERATESARRARPDSGTITSDTWQRSIERARDQLHAFTNLPRGARSSDATPGERDEL